MYFLPKVHKLNTQALKSIQEIGLNTQNIFPPGRPIISQCGSATELIGHYIDYFLVPIVQSQGTYIKDTTAFINIIERLKPQADCLLISYDITNMFTNMPIDQLLQSVETAYNSFDKTCFKIKPPPVNDLVYLLRILLENNVFEFAGKLYKQTIGTAIGSAPSPAICDILMFEISNQIISQFQHKDKIFYHGRYRDDGFIIYHNSDKNEVEDLFKIANAFHPLLKFTYEIAEFKITFLDVNVFKGSRFTTDGILDLETHFKPTNSFMYLHRRSSHCPHVFNGLIRGEAVRYVRNTNNEKTISKLMKQFRIRLKERGYSDEEIYTNIQKALSINRKELLKSKESTKDIPLVLITKYNPGLKKIKKYIMKHWHLLKYDETCEPILSENPMVAYKRHKNLGDILTSSLIK